MLSHTTDAAAVPACRIAGDGAAANGQRAAVIDAAAVIDGAVALDAAALDDQRAVVRDAAAEFSKTAGDCAAASAVRHGQRSLNNDHAAVLRHFGQAAVDRMAVQVQRHSHALGNDQRFVGSGGDHIAIQADRAARVQGLLQVGPGHVIRRGRTGRSQQHRTECCEEESTDCFHIVIPPCPLR